MAPHCINCNKNDTLFEMSSSMAGREIHEVQITGGYDLPKVLPENPAWY